MEAKIIFAIISSVVGVVCFFPYIRDTLKGKTKPHSYTWFIWALLQTIAAAAMWSGGAGFAIAACITGAVLCCVVFLLSLKFGTKNITRFDTVCLVSALAALVCYIFFHNPLLSIIFATITDAIGFAPTFRKAYKEPNTETASTHLLSGVSDLFAILAILNFNPTTSLYLFAVMVMDAGCGILILIRSRLVNHRS